MKREALSVKRASCRTGNSTRATPDGSSGSRETPRIVHHRQFRHAVGSACGRSETRDFRENRSHAFSCVARGRRGTDCLEDHTRSVTVYDPVCGNPEYAGKIDNIIKKLFVLSASAFTVRKSGLDGFSLPLRPYGAAVLVLSDARIRPPDSNEVIRDRRN